MLSETTDIGLPVIVRDGLRWYVRTEAGRYFGYRWTPWGARWLAVKAKRIMAKELPPSWGGFPIAVDDRIPEGTVIAVSPKRRDR